MWYYCGDVESNRLPVAERRGYTSVFNALSRIIREEGLLTLWRGYRPTIVRAMVGNAAQLASYSQAKQSILSTGKLFLYIISLLMIVNVCHHFAGMHISLQEMATPVSIVIFPMHQKMLCRFPK